MGTRFGKSIDGLFWEDCNMQEDAVLMVFSDKEKVLRKEDLEIFSTIRKITAKGK